MNRSPRPPCYLQTERHIQNYPLWHTTLRELDLFAESLCRSAGKDYTQVQVGRTEAFQDRVINLKEGWPRYQQLLKNCELMDEALCSLEEKKQVFVAAFFWEDHGGEYTNHPLGVARFLDISEATVWRWRREVLRAMAPFLVLADPDVLSAK